MSTDPNTIQAQKPAVIQLRTEKLEIPFRGVIESGSLNRFHSQVTDDLVNLQRQGNVNARAILNYAHTLQRETDTARQKAISNRAELDFHRRVSARQGKRIGMWVDMYDGSNISFIPGSDITRRANISTQYGEATLPMNAIESKTYYIAIVADKKGVTELDNVGAVTGLFDVGEGVEDQESGGIVEETDILNAANGQNLEYWRRRVIFDLESDVSEVSVEATLTLPPQSNIQANLLSIHPYPLGNVDVTGLWTSPDLSDSFSTVPGFSETRGVGKKRWFFPAQDVARVKVRLRQRNWVEENGRKVFEYGLQELGVMLAEWDQHYDVDSSSYADNHAFVTRVDALNGMAFNKLYGFYTTPDYTLEPAGSRHLHFAVSTDAEGSQILWDSDSTASPQSLDSPISLGGLDTFYIITTMNWAAAVAAGSPFQANTPPFLRGFGLDVTMQETI